MQKTKIALFPLQLFLLPGEKSRLHIFEPRYKQLLIDCEQNHTSFGIPLALKGALTGYGSIVKIINELNVHADGSSDIEILCEEVFKIDKFHQRMGEKLYPGGDVIILSRDKSRPVSEKFMNELGKYLESTKHEFIPELLSTQLDAFAAARIIELNELEKLKLVKSKSAEGRELVLLNKLKLLNRIQEQVKSIEGDIFLN